MMSLSEQIITVAVMAIAVMLTRFLPFLLFRGKDTPLVIRYLSTVLPAAVFGLLVVYCVRNVNVLSGAHGVPEAVGIIVTILLHRWKRQMLLSIAGGTLVYMLIVQNVHF